MKIPFDIKYRSQIESGEYKVVTGDDRPVRIISWDKKVYGGRFEIVALVSTSQGDTESVQLYCPNGTLIASNWSEKFKLFILTPEPELTEFEQALADTIGCAISQSVVEPNYETYKFVKDWSERLLDAAKKELCKGCAAKQEGYINGRHDALKEMDKVYKYEGPTPPVYWPSCRYGGYCTNPSQNCFTCPRGSITVGFNTLT